MKTLKNKYSLLNFIIFSILALSTLLLSFCSSSQKVEEPEVFKSVIIPKNGIIYSTMQLAEKKQKKEILYKEWKFISSDDTYLYLRYSEKIDDKVTFTRAYKFLNSEVNIDLGDYHLFIESLTEVELGYHLQKNLIKK